MIRMLDLTLSLAILIALSPVLVVIAILIRFKFGSPILFSQTRTGFHEKSFKLYKFRSMNSAMDAQGVLLPDADRLTAFGHKLRSTSLDELPGLLNVIKGDLSIIGPRPLLPEYLPLYNKRQRKRHEVRPGITGWAQINGRNSISWEHKFELDVWYVENHNIMLDIKILFATIYKVFKREGIAADGEVTMAKFTGTHESTVAQNQVDI